MRKKLLIVIPIVATLVIAVVVFSVINSLLKDGYAYYGDVWENTPEMALQKEAEHTSETQQTLTPKTVFEKTSSGDIVTMTFLSEAETLVDVTFVTNDDGQYSVYGWTEEWDLEQPSEFLMTGDPNQFILFPYQKYGDVIWGWCYTTAQFTVNGIAPTRKTFTFETEEKVYSIDYWKVNAHISDDDVSIEYITN